ncbi:MAG: CotH kinase family protein [Prevotella sp.]|nr:CotH kinase family protein [Prevotella sp.]
MQILLPRLLLLLAVVLSVKATGKPNLDPNKRYHIVCTYYSNGCVVDGASAAATTPLYHLQTATTDESTYWLFTEEQDGQYTIRNAATGKYITYDGQRSDAGTNGATLTRRYVDMTADVNSQYSLWTFQEYSDGVYAIRNVAQTDHIWDVRIGSFVVGTYSNGGSPNDNQRFLLIEETVPTSGIDVSTWLEATENSDRGWTNQGGWWINTGAGGSHYNNETGANLVQPFIELWRQSSSGALQDNGISQVLTTLPAGQYTLQADMMACRQSYGNNWNYHPDEPANNVVLYAGETEISVATGNDPPQHFTLDFTLSETSDIEIGVRATNTNANWIALDNLTLTYHGTDEELLEGERVKVMAVLAERLGEEQAAAQMAAVGDDFLQLEALRKSVANMPVADPIGKVLTDLRIDGRPVLFAESIGLYLCPIPLSKFGTDLTATISYTQSEGCGNLVIDDEEQPAGTSHTFASVEGGKNYTLKVTDAMGLEVSYPLTFTSLPVVQIYGSFNNSYSDGYITVTEPDKTAAKELLNMKAKWRGGITNGDNKHKRNYHVKLKDENGDKLEKKFFGLRNDNSWILESCQVDMSRIRNRTLTDLWNDYSTPPYYISEEKKAMTGTRGHFVELILNGEYRGIYCMTENLDRKQMKLKKYDEENEETHGQLWKSKDWTYATFMGTQPDGGYWPKDFLTDPDPNSEMWDQYEVKYPDFEDYGYQTDWEVLNNAVDFVCHSSDDDFKAHIAEYFDLPLVIDYYILMETILSTDNHGKNMFFGVYDKQVDKKITFSVWDMDATCGQRWSDDYYHWDGMKPEQDYATYIQQHEHGDYNLFKRLRDTDANGFNLRVRQRYRDLRQNELATESILKRFRTYLDEFKTAGTAQREYDRWNYDSDIAGHELDFDDEMAYLTDWFTRRMNYLDNTRFKISELPKKGDANGDGKVDIADVTFIVNIALGRPTADIQKAAADVNIDGVVDSDDVRALVNIIIRGE